MGNLEEKAQESERLTKEVVSKTPCAISGSALLNFLSKMTIVVNGRRFKAESIRCVDLENGDVWWPVNMNGLKNPG